jgi:hypothetical protein
LQITFSDDATTATFASVLNDLRDWTVDIDRTNDGYPARGVVKEADEMDGLTVYEADETGGPIRNSTYCIPWEALRGITIL